MTDFVVPNHPGSPVNPAGYRLQAAPDKVDWDAIAGGFLRTGVISGCEVTAHGPTDMAVAVAGGAIAINDVQSPMPANANLAIAASHPTLPRTDLVVGRPAGPAVLAGPPHPSAPIPEFDENAEVSLATVFVPAADTDIDADQVTRKRVLITASAGGVGAATITDWVPRWPGSPTGSGALTGLTVVRFHFPFQMALRYAHFTPTMPEGVGGDIGAAIYNEDGSSRLWTAQANIPQFSVEPVITFDAGPGGVVTIGPGSLWLGIKKSSSGANPNFRNFLLAGGSELITEALPPGAEPYSGRLLTTDDTIPDASFDPALLQPFGGANYSFRLRTFS